MSLRNSQLKSHVHHGIRSSDDDGGYISDSVLVTRRHHKNQRSHVTFSDDINDISDVYDTSRHRRAHFYTDDINDEAEEFIRLKHEQCLLNSN